MIGRPPFLLSTSDVVVKGALLAHLPIYMDPAEDIPLVAIFLGIEPISADCLLL